MSVCAVVSCDECGVELRCHTSWTRDQAIADAAAAGWRCDDGIDLCPAHVGDHAAVLADVCRGPF